MKKNISINISGIIFHIEEDGYETLRKYLDSVNRYFASFDDSSEILADIESRIAEIFLSRLNEGKQVITAEDVSALMSTMGSVSDFKAAEEQEFAAGDTSASSSQKEKTYSAFSTTPPVAKKLYRDRNRKMLGGVCAGLGHYFNIDPVWPRLIFTLLLLGYGFTLIVYVLLWIFLPETDLEEQASVKKMYRDPDKKVFGGVASGISAFFAIDLTLVRVLFVLAGIFFGTGIILYIVLWIALPEAKTITEKMEMQGEPVTLSNIESSVKKGMNEKEGEESALAKVVLFPFRLLAAIINGIAKFLGPVFKMLVDVMRVAIGLIISFMGLIIIFVLILFFGIVMGIFHAPEWTVSDWYLSTPNFPLAAFRNSFPTWTVVFTFLAAMIPAVFDLLLGISIIVRRIVFSATVGWSLFVTFFISVAVISFSLPQMILGFKEEGEYRVEQTYSLAGKTAVFKMNETGMDDYDVTSISLKGYDGKDIKIVEKFQSQGTSRKIAAENAQMVDYQIVQQDSVITFDSNITFKPEAKFRAQRLDIDVMIPYNQNLSIDASLWRMIDTDIIDYRNAAFHELNLESQTWKMTERGLQCTSCPKVDSEVYSPTAHDEYGLKNFSSVDLEGVFTVRIDKGDTYAVEIKGDESERRRYDVYVNGETLVIDYDDHRKFFWKKPSSDDDKLIINITMPRLNELEVAGVGKVRFNGFDEEEMDIKLTGAIVANGDFNADNLNIKMTGASTLDISGTGKFMDADILGASGLRAYGYQVEHCIVEAHGASSARVNVTGTLEIKKGIASTVSHRGNPEIIKR